MNKNFAMHLSGVLEGMSFEMATNVIQELTECPSLLLYSAMGWSGYECNELGVDIIVNVYDRYEKDVNHKQINLMQKYGIEEFGYRVEIKPTNEEMVKFLQEYASEYDEEDLVNETLEEIENQCNDYNVDEVLSYFQDVRAEWYVIVDDEFSSYKAGNDELLDY